MALLFNAWFPDGSALSKLSAHAYFNRLGLTSQTPVVEIPNVCELVPNPDDAAQQVLRTWFRLSDTDFVDGSNRVMMLPITPTAADGIRDWGGGYSAIARWYRVCFRVDVWPEEPQHFSGQQACVVWQLHDQADTGDTYVEPPLWIEDDGNGNWELWNTYDANAVSSISTRTHRLLARWPRMLGKWEHVVIYMEPSWTSGKLRVWRDHRRVFEESGVPNCFNHLPARGGSFNYVEYGVYGGKTGQLQDRQALHMGCQIGDESYSTYSAFMAACGSSSIELPRAFAGRTAIA